MTSPRKIFRESLKRLLISYGPLQTREIYKHIKSLHPDLCDDAIECTCGGTPNRQPEWKHQVRWAQQDLKYRGEIELVNQMWKII